MTISKNLLFCHDAGSARLFSAILLFHCCRIMISAKSLTLRGYLHVQSVPYNTPSDGESPQKNCCISCIVRKSETIIRRGTAPLLIHSRIFFEETRAFQKERSQMPNQIHVKMGNLSPFASYFSHFVLSSHLNFS